jgi:hypothetical protein
MILGIGNPLLLTSRKIRAARQSFFSGGLFFISTTNQSPARKAVCSRTMTGWSNWATDNISCRNRSTAPSRLKKAQAFIAFKLIQSAVGPALLRTFNRNGLHQQ